MNLNKLSRNFVGALRTTTTNCRVSFIDLYLVFPRNFRIVFLPHMNTVILLEPYCGTSPEPGLPVFRQAYMNFTFILSYAITIILSLQQKLKCVLGSKIVCTCILLLLGLFYFLQHLCYPRAWHRLQKVQILICHSNKRNKIITLK